MEGRGITTFKIGIFLLPCTEKMNDGDGGRGRD
jgi:hypothetical protein